MNSMLATFTAVLAILAVAVLINRVAARSQDVLSGRFFERSDREQR